MAEYLKDLHMDTKAFFSTLRKIPQEPKAIDVSQSYSMQSAHWWLLILLVSAFCVIAGCQRKIPEPGEPIIERQNENAAPRDRTENQEDNSGADR